MVLHIVQFYTNYHDFNCLRFYLFKVFRMMPHPLLRFCNNTWAYIKVTKSPSPAWPSSLILKFWKSQALRFILTFSFLLGTYSTFIFSNCVELQFFQQINCNKVFNPFAANTPVLYSLKTAINGNIRPKWVNVEEL